MIIDNKKGFLQEGKEGIEEIEDSRTIAPELKTNIAFPELLHDLLHLNEISQEGKREE